MGKNKTNIKFPHGPGPLTGETPADAAVQSGYDPGNVGQNSLPRLYGPGLGNPYGVTDFLGTSNVSDTRQHALNRERIMGALQMKGTDVDPAEFFGPQPTETK